MAAGEQTNETASLLDRLERARDRYREASERVEDYGEERLERLNSALSKADDLIARYEESATGTGDFEAFVTFQGKFAELVEGLPEELPERAAFETADDHFDKRRLSASDFDAARDALADARSVADLLDDREAAREAVSDARRAVSGRIDTLGTEIDRLREVRRFGDADLSAPTERVRVPIAAYDDRARALFSAARRTLPARELLTVVDETGQFPLVPFTNPPAELLAYLDETDVGGETVDTLVTYDDYSRSKLAHYVDDPGLFQARIAVHRTYLDRLSAEPLLVGWPPPEAGELRQLARELVAVTGRLRRRLDEAGGTVELSAGETSGDATVGASEFDPTETDAVTLARQLKRLPKETAYDRLRRAARADEQLTDEQRERLRSGAVEAELDQRTSERDRLRATLDERVI